MECLLYLGYYVNGNLFDEITSKGINNMSAASHNLEKSLLQEFSFANNLDFKPITYVPDSPLISVPRYSELGRLRVIHIPIVKRSVFSWIKAALSFAKYLFREIPDDANVLMYAVNPVFILPLCIAKKIKRLTLTTICSEVPSFRRYDKSLRMRIKQEVQTFFNNRFDKYILLTERMKDVVKVGSKPYMVMEGVASNLPDCPPTCKRRNVVMYAGGLHPDNNILLLIEACEKSDFVEECWICGSGPQEKEIVNVASNSNKIKFLGRKSHNEVLEMEKQVKILVNLRDPSNMLTEYSFPSKIIEYLASGAQVISTRLKGIPAEYFDYLTPLNSIDVGNLTQLIDHIISLPDDLFYSKAKDNLEYLKTKKSPTAQSKKILNFICQ